MRALSRLAAAVPNGWVTVAAEKAANSRSGSARLPSPRLVGGRSSRRRGGRGVALVAFREKPKTGEGTE